jgi:alginate O-acetyltransferase complex protein AlgI
MPLNSLKYLLFLPLVYLVFNLAGERARWCVLLAASFAFYAALKVPYLLAVLVLVTVTTYAFGIWLSQAQSERAKRSVLWGGILANVLILVVMKYLPFLSLNLMGAASWLSSPVQIRLVPTLVSIGVSYFIFQAMSYLFDIYLEIESPERHLGFFALYLAFFPKLLQGPIERAGDLLPQLKKCYRFDYDNARFGMLLFAWGLFKKTVLADRLGLQVDPVYDDVHAFTGWPLLFATYSYALQIYLDFSGYTDMALGSARLFNINLTQNFNAPYLAVSVADFWRRWHVSFSRWILDYIFKPLQMRWRDGRRWGTACALLVAFLVSGLWHGASWKFIVWGGLHGLYLASSVFYQPYQKKLHKALGVEKIWYLKCWRIFVTFNLVSLAWVFFRSNNCSDAFYLLTHLWPVTPGYLRGQAPALLSRDGGVLALLLLIPIAVALLKRRLDFSGQPAWVRWPLYYALGALILLFNQSSENFIYFRF